MRKSNRLISILLSVLMLVSVFPQVIFADGTGPVAKIGATEYETLDDAFADNYDGNDIELIADAEFEDSYLYYPCTVNMNGFSITATGDDGLCIYATDGEVAFNNGTINGNLHIDGDDTTITIINASADADYAVNGSVCVLNGSLKIRGAKVGLKGTLETASADIDIAGTEKAVELNEQVNLLGNSGTHKIVGATEFGGTLLDTNFDPGTTAGTYTVDGSPAIQIKIAPTSTKPKTKPSVSPNNVTIYTGQKKTFDITFEGTEKLVAEFQKSALIPMTAEFSDDQKTITITIPKGTPEGDYKFHVFVENDPSRSAMVEFTVAVCSHPTDKIEDDGGNAKTCKCTVCGINLVRLNRSDISGEYGYISDVKYFETIDEAIDAIPTFDKNPIIEEGKKNAGLLRYQYEVRYYEDITVDHDIEVKDKAFNIAPSAPNYNFKLSFTNGHSMKISRDIINDENAVDLYQIKNIGSITLGKNANLTVHSTPTIDKLILADKTASVYNIAKYTSANASSARIKIKNLVVTAPNCTIADFTNHEGTTLAYRHYDPNNKDRLVDYVNETDLKEVSNVAIIQAPILKFTPELDEASKNAVYPGAITINLNAEVDSGATAEYKVTGPDNLLLSGNYSWFVSPEKDKIIFERFPAGTYNVAITAEATARSIDKYITTKYVTVTVGKKPITDSSIKILIDGKDEPYNFAYPRKLQHVTINVKDTKTNEDITQYFDATGALPINPFYGFGYISTVGDYAALFTAKEDSNYTGSKEITAHVTKIDPVENTDYKIDIPSSLTYDGTPKGVTVQPLDSEIEVKEIKYEELLQDGTYGNGTTEAPVKPGTYRASITLSEDMCNYNSCTVTKEFTIEKAYVKFEYTKRFDEKAWYYYEEDKKVAGKIVSADTAAANAKVPEGNVRIEQNGSTIKETTLSENGEFEFDLSYLPVKIYNFKIVYDGNENYNSTNEDHFYSVSKNYLENYNVSNTEQRYSPGVERKITVSSPDSTRLTNDDFVVKYYLVDENSGRLVSAEPVNQTISAGRYLYVISLKDEHTKNYGYIRKYSVDDPYNSDKTKIPDISYYGNVGFMDIKAASEVSQKPISFAKGVVNIKSGEKYTNTLKNENNSTVTYESSDTDVAYVDRNGEITAKKSGTATITATSIMEGATPVYASYTVNVKKELTKDSFDIIAQTKSYDGSKSAVVAATLKDGFKVDPTDVVKAEITAEFDRPDAGDRIVSYEITGISGKNADKYILSETAESLKDTVSGTIEKAAVTVICPKVTTRTFDGTVQTVDVSAMANGKIFDSSNFTVKYEGENTAVNVGEYTISIELTENAGKNYTVEPFDAVLKIVNAAQDIFAIENVPENVYYGNTFTVSATGAGGDVTYEITEGADIAETTADGVVTVKNVGKVTIKATSKKDGYTDRTALKTFEAKKRILTPSASAANRTYNGENGVDVEITLSETLSGDSITASASGSMINADAGNGKIVYVSGITLSDNIKYTLSTNTLQTTVNILPIEITGFTISANGKKYDGTVNAQASVDEINNVTESDKGFVSIVGTAEFDTADSGTDKTVTFTASGLSGAKSQNYTLGKTSATANASIEPLKVNFTVGQTTFVYDGKDKGINISATDENGRIFDGFTVNYDKTPNAAGTYTAKISLNDANNYITDQGDITVTVENAMQNQLVIAGLPGTVEYGDEFKLEAFGGADNGTVLWRVTEGNASISQDGEVTVNGTGKIEITATKSSENYSDISSKVVFTAMPKNIVFELGNLEQTFGRTLGYVKVIPSDPRITAGDFEVTYNGSAEFPTNAGKYKVEVKTTNANYKGLAYDTLVIAKAQASGKIQINNRFVYGDTISASVTDIPDGTDKRITYAGTGIYIPQEEAPKNAGNYTVIAEITGENYETLTITKNFTIEKANLIVKAQNASRAYGDANPVFKLIYDGFVNGDDESVLLYEPTAKVNANASSAVGKYNITVSGGYAENYKFTYDNTGELEITGAIGAVFYITGSNTAYVNDKFALNAFYGNTKINAAWESSNTNIAEIDENGTVTAKSAGTVTITATADANYGNAEATFNITIRQSGITLVPTDLVKTYNGERQEISFEPISGFTPVIGQNVIVKYVLTTDPTVTEPIKTGTYSVTYTISDESFSGGGTATMYITKANIKLIPKDITKIYGDEPKFELVPTIQTALVSGDELKELAKNARFTSDGSAETANVGQYDITAVLGAYENENINFVIDGMGSLTVTKALLKVKVKDVSREYGTVNPPLEVEYEGFKNGETKDVLDGTLVLLYDGIIAETNVGTYTDKTSASGLTSDNYEINYKKGNVTITPIIVTASAGTAKKSYLTITFDKAVEGLTKDRFTVKTGGNAVELTSVTESTDGKSYTLNGSFVIGVEYTVEISYENNNYSIIGSPLRFTPSGSSGGSGGGGSGSSSVLYYTVSFNTSGGEIIASQTVKKNETAKEPTEPKKDGFVFDGWYFDKSLSVKYDFAGKITKNITLYAKWSESTEASEEKQIIFTIGEKSVRVFGQIRTNDVAPKIVNGRTMLPARFVAESLGADVSWDGEKELVTIQGKNLKTGEDITILIYIGSDIAYVNGKEIKLDSPSFVENDRTYTPIRFISEELGASVEWLESEQKVVIRK